MSNEIPEQYIQISLDLLLSEIDTFIQSTNDTKHGSIQKMRHIINLVVTKLLYISENIDEIICRDELIEFSDSARSDIENIFQNRIATPVAISVQHRALCIIGQFQDLVKSLET